MSADTSAAIDVALVLVARNTNLIVSAWTDLAVGVPIVLGGL